MVINGKSAAAALVKARASISATVVRDAKANYGKYATLAAVMEAISPALSANGLALVQEAELSDGEVTMCATLVHESGETIEFTPLAMPLGTQRTAQAVGSAMSYGRRYQLTSLFGLAPDDDDGEAASKTPQTPAERTNGRTTYKQASPPAKTPQRPPAQPTAHIDEVAEVDPDGNPFVEEAPAIPQRGQPITENTLKRLHIVGGQVYGADWDAKRPTLVEAATKGAETSSKELTEAEARTLIRGMEAKIAKAQQPDAKAKEAA